MPTWLFAPHISMRSIGPRLHVMGNAFDAVALATLSTPELIK